MESKNILLKKKEFILNHYLNDDELKIIKPMKFLFLIKDEIENLQRFYSKKEIHQMINSIFDKNLSLSLVYHFSSKNLSLNLNDGTNKKLNNNQLKSNSSSNGVKNNIGDLTNMAVDFISKNLPKK